MRVAALADVHGNATALEAVLAELEREQPDLIVSCGDLTWGSLPRETVALLEPWRERVLYVRGNSERELQERKLLDSDVARWEFEQHDDPELDAYVRSTQAQVAVDVDGLGPTLFCHGSPRSDEECVTSGHAGRTGRRSSRPTCERRASSRRTRTCSTTGAWGRHGC